LPGWLGPAAWAWVWPCLGLGLPGPCLGLGFLGPRHAWALASSAWACFCLGLGFLCFVSGYACLGLGLMGLAWALPGCLGLGLDLGLGLSLPWHLAWAQAMRIGVPS